MATHVAFLRAVNVGGRGVVRMEDVRAAFATAGAANVRTFIQSGNVLFDGPATRTGALFARIHVGMRSLLGQEPGIVFRTLDEVEAIVRDNRFGDRVDDRLLKLYVVFADREIASRPPLPLVVAKEGMELIAIAAREAFIVSRRKPNGMYGFPNAVVERLGVMATSRNWTTVTKLAAFARAVK